MSERPLESDPKAELEAMSTVLGAVESLSHAGVTRVLNWVAESIGVVAPGSRLPAREAAPAAGAHCVQQTPRGRCGTM